MERSIKALMFYLSIAMFIIVIIGKVNGEQSMTVYEEPKGQNVTLHCPITLTSELLAVYWKKNGINILTPRSGHDPSQPISKYGLTGNTSLTITDIDKSDAANYTCKVLLSDGGFPESDAIQLFVTELSVSHCPDARDSGDDVDECDCHVDGNKVRSLTCTAHGFARKPSISWKLGGKVRLESSVVNLTAYSNNRTLVCLAEDPVLRNHPLNDKHVCVYYQKQDIELSVSHCPNTQDSGDEVDECDCHIDGNNVRSLTCTAHGFPYKPAISWKLGDKIRLDSSTVNLADYSNNKTLVCLAEDPVLRDRPLKNKHVCLYYQKQDTESWQVWQIVTVVIVVITLIALLIGVGFLFNHLRGHSKTKYETTSMGEPAAMREQRLA